MPDQNPLPSQLAESLRQQGGAQIVVGLPSYNNTATIVGVVEAIRQGLREAYPDHPAIIVNTDGGSTDGTVQQLAELAATDGARVVQLAVPAQGLDMPYHGLPGKGDGLHLTLRIAALVGARVCLVLTPGITNLPRSWIPSFLAPVLEQGFDLVLPLYARHHLDGALTSGVVRPLVCCLYGHHIEQPMAGEYAMSGALVERCLAQPVWGTELGQLGTDIWTTTQALCTAGKACQVHLGRKTTGDGPSVDLGTTLTQVLGALFEDMRRNAPVWQRVRGWQPVTALGTPADSADAPAPNLDSRKLGESFRLGLRNLQDLWALVLPPATLLELKRAAASPPETFTLSDELWSRAVFDFALGYRMRTLNRHHLLGSFMPLYLGWLASFARDIQTVADVDRRAQRLCKAYGTQKPYLISRWRSPDRFNP